MIRNISPTSSVENNSKHSQNKTKAPVFGGWFDSGLNALTTGLQYSDKYPMVGVSIVDATTAIIPRTWVGFKTNIYSGFEWFRKESSGLIVNCLIPSWIVLLLAKCIQKPILDKFAHVNMASSWANQESLELLRENYQKSNHKTSDFVRNTLQDVKGLDGSNWVNYKDKNINRAIDNIVKLIDEAPDKKTAKKLMEEAYQNIVKETKAAEFIKFGKKEEVSSLNLSSLLRDMVDLGKKFKDGVVSADLSGFEKVATKLVNRKSLIGLFGIIIPLASSMQYINRELTKKMSGINGAPIYKDFGKEHHKVELDEKEEKELFSGKIKSSLAMLAVAWLSMLKIPKLKNLQFKGIFPTLDQCRLISTATILGRIWKAQDKNDLRESTELDIGTFAGLYFLGDYASKGLASVFEKAFKVKLLNRTEVVGKDASVFKKFANWMSHVKLKSFDEVGEDVVKHSFFKDVKVKNLRSLCQIGNLGFSMLLLGFVLPYYTRKKTESWEQENSNIQRGLFGQNQAAKSGKEVAFKEFMTVNKN